MLVLDPILDAVFISIPERWGEGVWEVPLRDILESHEVIGEGCPGMPEECPQLTFSELIDPETLAHFVDAWRALEVGAQKAGGSLVIRCSFEVSPKPATTVSAERTDTLT